MLSPKLKNRLILLIGLLILFFDGVLIFTLIFTKLWNSYKFTFDYSMGPFAEKIQQLTQAEARWAANGYSSYRIVFCKVDDYGNPLTNTLATCPSGAEIEVSNEKVINGGSAPFVEVPTIYGLFKQLEQDTTHTDWGNYPCDFINVYAVYDPNLGYPSHVYYQQEAVSEDNVGDINYGNYLSSVPLKFQGCYLLGFYKPGYTIKSVTPIIGEEF